MSGPARESAPRHRSAIGGEAPCPAEEPIHRYLTDSGRSSLRLLLRSGFARRRFLVPDFVCGVIPRILEEERTPYGWYRINDDLSIDAASLRGQSFDVLYVIDYFGQPADYAALVGPETWVVQDSAFSPALAPPGRERWTGFNSLRKVTSLADGSVVRSTAALDETLIQPLEAPFAAAKVRAQDLKWRYLRRDASCEADYLAEFERGEALIDGQDGIHAISPRSLHRLLDLYADLEAERGARRRNVAVLDRALAPLRLPLKADFPSFYVLRVERREALREFLRERRIFLPVHWPNARGSDNPLYRSVISVPVDSRYGEDDMRRVSRAIGEFHGLGR